MRPCAELEFLLGRPQILIPGVDEDKERAEVFYQDNGIQKVGRGKRFRLKRSHRTGASVCDKYLTEMRMKYHS